MPDAPPNWTVDIILRRVPFAASDLRFGKRVSKWGAQFPLASTILGLA